MTTIAVKSSYPDVYILSSDLLLRASWLQIEDRPVGADRITVETGPGPIARAMMAINKKLGITATDAYAYILADDGGAPVSFFGWGDSVSPVVLCDLGATPLDVASDLEKMLFVGKPTSMATPRQRVIPLAELFKPRFAELTPEALRTALTKLTEHLRGIPASEFRYIAKGSVVSLAVLYDGTTEMRHRIHTILSTALVPVDGYIDDIRPS